MIVKSFRRAKAAEDVETKGFDAFELRLGDLMRGERATMGKSLLDVQRELKIKAAYIAAIENSDPSAFDTPGFIAGYVRSYARYLHMDPDWAFEKFCKESGFATAHGMSAAASAAKPARNASQSPLGKDIFASSATPFIPARDAMFSRIEPAAIGSVFVLVALIGGLGYGGWSVLQEVQKVQFAPVEQTPTVISDLDPLAGGGTGISAPAEDTLANLTAPSPEALDRLYRPQALEVPVLVARDAPISTLVPGSFGAVESPTDGIDAALAQAVAENTGPAVQVNEGPIAEVALVAVRPAWVRVRSADGSVIYEGIMDKGDTFELPATEDPATLRVGESGAIYFAVNGTHYGPAGPNGTVTSNLALDSSSLKEAYAVADLNSDNDLAAVVNVAEVSVSE
ncbi:protein RodZ, contains Xre-like HTH and DUF4115 domains [Cognatiyoonia koreensis]|uniref:Protein RodZ, contains Xre-like HTH and DUF4115 domains n=1 Tax=Cognatiyoonia koreensis TaxID=364200 RepID=A0A1I0PPC9_9RHOB|nr:helix-turn-helix domain-containing protein [Cognatiyoonia koreensis]SEW16216.1 protein RodZ, contains Xre-like HTH and DUF4115 domains [Cognatiyoonia koreensis]